MMMTISCRKRVAVRDRVHFKSDGYRMLEVVINQTYLKFSCGHAERTYFLKITNQSCEASANIKYTKPEGVRRSLVPRDDQKYRVCKLKVRQVKMIGYIWGCDLFSMFASDLWFLYAYRAYRIKREFRVIRKLSPQL